MRVWQIQRFLIHGVGLGIRHAGSFTDNHGFPVTVTSTPHDSCDAIEHLECYAEIREI
jgi:hypothetical protein